MNHVFKQKLKSNVGQLSILCISFFLLQTQIANAQPLLQRNASSAPATVTQQNQQTVVAVRDYELYQRIEAMQEEIQMLRGTLEEQNYTIELMKKAERERFIDLDRRINQLSSVGTKTPATAGGFTANVFDDEQAAYQKAKKRIDDKEYNAAIAEMSLYLEIFPRGQYVAQAHYWLGELYTVLDVPEFDNAQKHFQIILNEHPQHSKVPDALFKLGKLNDQQGKKTQAKVFFDRLLKEFPSSSAAALAKQHNPAL